MATFRYRAYGRDGRILAGKVEAPTAQLAESAITERGLEIIVFEEVHEWWRFFLSWGTVRTRELVIFTRELTVLIAASVPLVQALRTISAQTSKPALKRILQQVSNEVEAGARFSLALTRHPRVFDAFFVSMIKSGETAGRLSEVVNFLADQKEKEHDLKLRIQGAMLYPAFIVAGMVVVGIILLVFVIPQLTSTLLESGVRLPWTTRALISVSHFLRQWWGIILPILLFFVGAGRLALNHEPVRYVWDQAKLRLPILGGLFQKISMTHLSRSLSTLLQGGIDVAASLEVAQGVVGNAYYRRLLVRTRKEVEDGNPLTYLLMQDPLIPEMVSQILKTGEETGKLTEVLDKLAAFYTREVDNGVNTLVSIIEPALMVFIGVGVGLVVASIILPMYQLAGQF